MIDDVCIEVSSSEGGGKKVSCQSDGGAGGGASGGGGGGGASAAIGTLDFVSIFPSFPFKVFPTFALVPAAVPPSMVGGVGGAGVAGVVRKVRDFETHTDDARASFQEALLIPHTDVAPFRVSDEYAKLRAAARGAPIYTDTMALLQWCARWCASCDCTTVGEHKGCAALAMASKWATDLANLARPSRLGCVDFKACMSAASDVLTHAILAGSGGSSEFARQLTDVFGDAVGHAALVKACNGTLSPAALRAVEVYATSWTCSACPRVDLLQACACAIADNEMTALRVLLSLKRPGATLDGASPILAEACHMLLLDAIAHGNAAALGHIVDAIPRPLSSTALRALLTARKVLSDDGELAAVVCRAGLC